MSVGLLLEPVGTVHDAPPDPEGLARALSGTVVAVRDGATIVVEARVPLADSMNQTPDGLASLLRTWGPADGAVGRAILLDVETTGLLAGAGTFAIVAGLGFVEGPELVVRQFFLHEPAAERAFLTAIADLIDDFQWLITFNGKRFDLPVLDARYCLHRQPSPFPSRHVDLLYPARRIWRRRLGRSNLATIEERVLGVVRERDVPGSEIPMRYFDFLRDRRVDLVAPVLDHNRQDVISMAQLAGQISLLLQDDGVAGAACPSDLLGLGSLIEQGGRLDRAARCYEAALVGASPSERADALLRLAAFARKSRELDRAIQLYDAVSQYSTHQAARAAIELAKIHEHQTRRPDRALDYARRAIHLTHLHQPTATKQAIDDLTQRIARLEAKIAATRILGKSAQTEKGAASSASPDLFTPSPRQ